MDFNIYNSLYYQALSIIAANSSASSGISVTFKEVYDELCTFAQNNFTIIDDRDMQQLATTILGILNDIVKDSYTSPAYDTTITVNPQGNFVITFQWNLKKNVSIHIPL